MPKTYKLEKPTFLEVDPITELEDLITPELILQVLFHFEVGLYLDQFRSICLKTRGKLKQGQKVY